MRSVRRAQKFVEVTVAEWEARTMEEDGSIIRVRKHKTLLSGHAEMMLNTTEERALVAYMRYARRIVTPCKSPTCPVFISSIVALKHGECCGKLNLSNITTIVGRIAKKAGITATTVNTRLLRRSTVSAAWKANPDPGFRAQLSHLAKHSYQTASRYYAVYDTSKQSREVVRRLDAYRE